MNRHTPTKRLQRLGGFIIIIPVLIGLIAGLYGASGAKAGQVENEYLVRCNPAVAGGPLGQPLDVDIYIENATDLWAADIRMSFDTSKALIVDADANAGGVQIELLDDFLSPDFVLRRTGDNVAGTIWYAATQIASPIPGEGSLPVTGSGSLARVTFQPLQAGTFTMPFTYLEIIRYSGIQTEIVPATSMDCKVTFIDIDNPDLTTYLPVAFSQGN